MLPAFKEMFASVNDLEILLTELDPRSNFDSNIRLSIFRKVNLKQ